MNLYEYTEPLVRNISNSIQMHIEINSRLIAIKTTCGSIEMTGFGCMPIYPERSTGDFDLRIVLRRRSNQADRKPKAKPSSLAEL